MLAQVRHHHKCHSAGVTACVDWYDWGHEATLAHTLEKDSDTISTPIIVGGGATVPTLYVVEGGFVCLAFPGVVIHLHHGDVVVADRLHCWGSYPPGRVLCVLKIGAERGQGIHAAVLKY